MPSPTERDEETTLALVPIKGGMVRSQLPGGRSATGAQKRRHEPTRGVSYQQPCECGGSYFSCLQKVSGVEVGFPLLSLLDQTSTALAGKLLVLDICSKYHHRSGGLQVARPVDRSARSGHIRALELFDAAAFALMSILLRLPRPCPYCNFMSRPSAPC